MSVPAIKVENLGKQYILNHLSKERYTNLRDVIARRAKSIFSSDPKASSSKEEFWALQDISFELEPGARLGIIGRNGAGKSTLLKILSRITEPTNGRVTIEGRVASLLEVGTGFHPELSGRENIYLNGSILGMDKAEIRKKFDEIVAFAEVERFLDTPVKRYSSGMYVRLAFAVAAHLEPEILIVDEVLAVGDAAFQKKCLGKMRDVSGQGRTVIFVSHNMEAVQKLCTTGLLLHKGKLVTLGPIEQVTRKYMEGSDTGTALYDIPVPENKEKEYGFVHRIQVEDEKGNPVPEIPVGANWQIRVLFRLNRVTPSFVAGLGLVSYLDFPIRTSWSQPADTNAGEYEVLFKNDDLMLVSGQYKLVIGLSAEGKTFQYINELVTLSISEISTLTHNERIVNQESGLILNPMNITITPLK